MAEDSKQYQEEEYLFSEDNSVSDSNSETDDSFTMGDGEASQTDQTPSAPTVSKVTQWRKNIFIGCGFLVVVLIVYKIIGGVMEPKASGSVNGFTSSQPIVANGGQNQNSAAVVQPSQANAQNVIPVSTTPSLHEVVNLYNQKHDGANRVAKLEVVTDSLQKEVDNLNNVTQSLQSSVEQMNTQLSQVNASLAILTDKIQLQETQRLAAQKKSAVRKMHVVTRPAIKKMGYYIMAIIPGRAWLKVSDGSTITVSQGTLLPGYGSVAMIDPKLGQVVMSSGQVIQYSSDDQ